MLGYDGVFYLAPITMTLGGVEPAVSRLKAGVLDR